MALSACYIIIILGIAAIAKAITYTSVVEIEDGPVRGELLKTVRRNVEYASFKGIRYAEPPVGHLRFKPPIKKEKWTDLVNATREGNVCLQYERKNSSVIGSEDCLFLNVFTPLTNLTDVKQNDPKAVMVWIYGGSFTEGFSNSKMYGPDFLIEDDVILVSFNYRVGPLGFLNLHHKNATGNAGLKDQNLALKWVNKNIEKFGGDPNKVTIFGQSAGSASVDLHVLSDMSSGLFKQSIAMSGSPLCLFWGFQSYAEAIGNAFKLGSKLGINTISKDKLLKVLQQASATDIILKAHEMLLMPFRPTIESWLVARDEEKFVSQCSVDKYRLGKYNKGPHMMGFTSAEFKGLADTDISYLANKGLESLANASIPFVSPLLRQLISAGSFDKLPENIAKQLIKLLSDLFYITGIDSKQQLLNKRNEYPIYYYRFSYNTDKYPGWRENSHNFNISGAGHAEDLPYIFYMSDLGLPDDAEIQKIINRHVRLITNFAKYGNPTPNGTSDPLLGLSWPNSGILGRYLDINADLTTGLRPIDAKVISYQKAGLGTSRILNQCI